MSFLNNIEEINSTGITILSEINHSICYPKITPLSFYLFIILTPITFVLSLAILITWWKIKECRKPPGDLFLWITLGDLIYSIHWFIMAIYSTNTSFGFEFRDQD